MEVRYSPRTAQEQMQAAAWTGQEGSSLTAGRLQKLIGVHLKGNQAGQPLQSLRDGAAQHFREDC